MYCPGPWALRQGGKEKSVCSRHAAGEIHIIIYFVPGVPGTMETRTKTSTRMLGEETDPNNSNGLYVRCNRRDLARAALQFVCSFDRVAKSETTPKLSIACVHTCTSAI